MSYENTNPRRHVAVPDIIKKLEYFSEHDFLLKGLKSGNAFCYFCKTNR
jgi:D-alanyl-D-alanine dipeptidase